MHITRHFYLFLAATLLATAAFAQPSNDDCDAPIVVDTLINHCSVVGAFTNVGATPSSYGAATCFTGSHKDVWFRFTPLATDVTILIRGATAVSPGGTLNNPEIALYNDNNCVGVINQLQCETDAIAADLIELYKGGLTPGSSYLIRVQGRIGNVGTFEMCINNYNPPALPGSDCITASVLCDKSPFVVQSITGSGNDAEGSGSCLTQIGPAETNSSWFTWTCDQAGTLEFTLTPTSTTDDLDFAVYELPNGVDDCSGSVLLRCCASGDFTFPSPCMGPTGINEPSSDTEEPAGCDDPTQDNFVDAINMVSGVSYGVLINNFTSTGNGYQIGFGGTGTFLGPDAIIATVGGSDTICLSETAIFVDASSFPNGTIVSSEWNFGAGASPQTANGAGPHNVNYSTPGFSQITLTITTDKGCKVTTTDFVTILGSLELDTLIVPPTCNGGQDGSLTLIPVFGTPPFSYNFGSGFGPSGTLSNIGVGLYTVTVQDVNGCSTVQSIQVNELVLDLNATGISAPSCFGYADGSITVILSNGVGPYQYNFGSGFSGNNILDNISAGNYSVTVTDANLCTGTALFEVVDHPIVAAAADTVGISCFGADDGSAIALPSGGVGNFSYLWDTNATDSLVSGLTPGLHSLTVTDGNGCSSVTSFSLYEPPQLFIDITGLEDLLCFGDSSGQISVVGSGGRGDYTYSVDGGIFQSDTVFVGLQSGEHLLTVKDSLGCTATVSGTLIEPEKIIIDAGPSITINLGDSTQLEVILLSPPGWEVGYVWLPDSSLNSAIVTNPWASPVHTTTYEVIATDSIGCQGFDLVTVIVNPYRPIFIPNVFTPNDDGNNDFFSAFANAAALDIALLRVYDRWGTLIYEAENLPLNNPSAGWDGMYRGKKLGPDVYVYYMKVRFIDGVEIFYKGDINIIK